VRHYRIFISEYKTNRRCIQPTIDAWCGAEAPVEFLELVAYSAEDFMSPSNAFGAHVEAAD
jgi:hypothetical protein